MELLLATIFGLLVGSFLNVVIYRLPEGSLSLIKPRSFCPKCKRAISWFCNIPLVSFILLRGRCRKCKNKIHYRYIIVELLGGFSAFFSVYTFGISMQAFGAAVFSWFLIALIFIDLENQILPDELTIILLWLGLLFSANGFFVTPESAIIGAICGYLSLWVVARVFSMIRKVQGMGYGDFKLFAALGAWLGWQMLPIVLLFASLTGAIIGISMILSKKHSFKQPIPFGPHLALAGWLAFFYGQEILYKIQITMVNL